MVAGFRRSISLPGPKDSGSPAKGYPPLEKSYHVRSTSLPCRSHPLISQLQDEVVCSRAWQSSAEPAGPPSSAWLRSGLIRLELLLLALDDLLQLPQTRDCLRRSKGDASGLAERLLEDFLCFVDAYGSFRSALVCLQELQSAAQVAVRRRDGARLATVARSLRKAEKEVAGLALLVLCEASRSAEPALALAASSYGSSAAYVELAGVMREVKSVTVSVSAAVFQGTAAALSTATAAVAPKSSCWRALSRRLAASSNKKKVSNEAAAPAEEGVEWVRRASERLAAMEELVVGLESGSERVFRNLINTRVSLLNILTP